MPRNKKRRADQRFTKVLTQLQAKQKDEQFANHEKKKALSQKLADAIADHQGGAPGQLEKLAKQIQRDWEQVGITLRKKDQRLWRQFRGLCDQVFAIWEAMNQQKKVQNTLSDQQLKAVAINLESLVNLGNICPKQLRTLSNEFEATEQLHKNVNIHVKFQNINDAPRL